jgi:hypothetical protein
MVCAKASWVEKGISIPTDEKDLIYVSIPSLRFPVLQKPHLE